MGGSGATGSLDNGDDLSDFFLGSLDGAANKSTLSLTMDRNVFLFGDESDGDGSLEDSHEDFMGSFEEKSIFWLENDKAPCLWTGSDSLDFPKAKSDVKNDPMGKAEAVENSRATFILGN